MAASRRSLRTPSIVVSQVAVDQLAASLAPELGLDLPQENLLVTVAGQQRLPVRREGKRVRWPGVPDSYDNAVAESVIGLYKTEVIRRCGPWRNVEAVEIATLEWVHWFNHKRLLEPIGHVPPAEFELIYYQTQSQAAVA